MVAKLSLIGFGEAAQAFADGAGWDVRGFDIADRRARFRPTWCRWPRRPARDSRRDRLRSCPRHRGRDARGNARRFASHRFRSFVGWT